ncbi:peptide ABC transporter substrate-binding protein, partial [Halobacteriales archaeon SW_12_71_31]
MEDAGFGPDNRYNLRWLQYQSPSYEEMANQIRSRLEAAYVDMEVNSADFGPLLSQARNGNVDAFTLGWIADYPAADNFLQLIDPSNTDYSQGGAEGAYVYWTEDADRQTDPDAREFGEQQWDRVANNPAPVEEQTEIRDDAYVKLEEAMWADVPLIPNFHGSAEPMWYDYVDYNPHGAMGGSRAKNNQVTLDSGDDVLDLTNSTITTFDPIRSTDTAGGTVIQNVFDALTNYPNGQTNVQNLLAEDFELSEDATTYEFSLKDAQFHDGSDVTASDFVYSFRRLAESENSRRVSFLADFLGISHEAEYAEFDEDGNPIDDTRETAPSDETPEGKQRVRIVPDTLAVEAVDDSTFRVELDEPFASALSLLAYTSFSAIPEGIVGDIEGYDGETEYTEFATASPVGAGPFEFGNWEQGSEVFVTRFEDYHGSVADVEEVNWAIIEDSNAAFNRFLNQNSDIGGVPTAQFDPELVSIDETDGRGRELGTYGPLDNDETVNYAKIPEVSTYYIGFNMENVPLAVRKAMAYVVDNQEFSENIFKGRNVPAFHLTPP